MRWIDTLRLRARSLFRRSRVDRDLDRELRFHVEMEIEELMASGVPPEEARTQALRRFGGLSQVGQDCRDTRGLTLLDDLRQDARYAARALARHPGFTLVAILTLALGIGANTAIFSVVRGVLLKPLPYPHPDRLVSLYANTPASESPTHMASRDAARITETERAAIESGARTVSLLAFTGFPAIMTLSGRGETRHIEGMGTAPRLFDLLGVPPLLGRAFGRDDDASGAEGVLLLSYDTWRRDFDGDPHIIGERVTLADSLAGPTEGAARPYTIVGVMPEGFAFGGPQIQFWMPSRSTVRSNSNVIARLAEGATREAASTEINTLLHALRPNTPGTTFDLTPLQDGIVEPVRPALRVLMVAVACVLLIACVNLANLLLARAAARQREIAIRFALGAGRARVIRQLLTESVLLSLIGGAAGALVGLGGIRLLRVLATTFSRMDLGIQMPFPRLEAIDLDASVLAFTLAVSLAAGLLFGVAPALHLARAGQLEWLREGAASAVSGFGLTRRHRMRGLLVIAEIALAMILLAGGGLLIHSFVRLSRVDRGFDATRLLTFQVAMPPDGYTPARLVDFAERLTAALHATPGVEAAGYARQVPMVLLRDSYAFGQAPHPKAPPPPALLPDSRLVSHDYLRTIGARLIAGRGFDARDDRGRPRVLIVNQALVQQEFHGDNPIGRLVYTGPDDIPWTVIGVVEDVRQLGLDRTPMPQYFVDIRQWPLEQNLFPLGPYYVLRTNSGVDRAALLAAIGAAARRLEASAGLYHVATMDALVANSTSRPRMYATLLGIFAGVSACLAAIGLYGVMAYAVAQRTREIAIRMALGAHRRDVLGLVLGQSLLLIGIGIGLGIAGAAVVTRYLAALLFGLTPLDATTFVGAAILFALVSLLASYVPARRATRVDPLIALRFD